MRDLGVAKVLEGLRPLCIGMGEGIAALSEYATLAEQGKVLAALLPDAGKDSRLLGRGKSGLRIMEERLLVALQPLIPVNEGAVECLVDDETVSPLADIPFHPWFPHGDEMQGEELEYFPEAERLACLLSWGATPEQVADSFGLDESPVFAPPKYEDVLAQLEKQPEPVRYLADALRVVNKDTGTFLWDGLCECGGACGCGVPWGIKAIRMIADQRPEADAIGERLTVLSKWIKEAPETRVPELLRAMEARP